MPATTRATRLTPPRPARWLAALALTCCASAQASFDIQINYSGTWTSGQLSAFAQAESFWESTISGYQPGVSLTGLNIDAASLYIDGAYGVLGSAGPLNGVVQAGHVLPTSGSMRFDSADLAAMESTGSFASVVTHEMGHVIGFGTLWTWNGVYVDGSGKYTGLNALAAWRSEFNQPLANWVPVELGGGPGTADGHWNEIDLGAGPTGYTDGQGRDLRDEVMTGWLNAGPNTFMSQTTKASMMDLGYTVYNMSPVPEPASWLLFALGAPLALRRRRPAGAPSDRTQVTSPATPDR
jgi:hypothetical protein